MFRMPKFRTLLMSFLLAPVFALVPLAANAMMSSSSILSAVNAERARAGLNALSTNSQLQVAAQMKAEDMASRNYFAHNSPEGQTPWDLMAKVGYNWSWAGENLAVSTE